MNPPPLRDDARLCDAIRCGSCRNSTWLDMFKTLACSLRGYAVVDPVRNVCDAHSLLGARDE